MRVAAILKSRVESGMPKCLHTLQDGDFKKRFASEIITSDSNALQFDDIANMQDYLNEKPGTKIAALLMNCETKIRQVNAATFVNWGKELNQQVTVPSRLRWKPRPLRHNSAV